MRFYVMTCILAYIHAYVHTCIRACIVVWEMRFYMMALNLLLHVSGLIGTVVPKNEVLACLV